MKRLKLSEGLAHAKSVRYLIELGFMRLLRAFMPFDWIATPRGETGDEAGTGAFRGR